MVVPALIPVEAAEEFIALCNADSSTFATELAKFAEGGDYYYVK